jgi:ketosteroid isomerase-like protein
MLVEDAIVLRDRALLRSLFDERAVLAITVGGRSVRGRAAIAAAASALVATRAAGVAAAGRVLQAGDTALVLSDGAIEVARRTADGAWRVTIALLEDSIHDTVENP